MGTASNATPLNDQAILEICLMYRNGRKEIETLNGREDDEARGHMEALKMAVRALEEKENGFRTKGDRTYQIGV